MRGVLTLLIVAFLLTISFGLSVVATINPYYLILKDLLAGSNSELSLLVKPSTNPHTFSPTISDVKRLTSADIIFANGLELEPYLKSYKAVIYLSDFVPRELLLYESEEQNHEGESHGQINPHIWVSPQLVKDYILPTMVKVLSEKDPKNKETFEKNAERLNEFLTDIVNRFDEILNGYERGVLVITHPSNVYLTGPYGIETLSLEEGHGKDPSAKKVREIIEKAKDGKLLGIFAEAQFNVELLNLMAKELKREIVILDPLGINAKGTLEYYKDLLKAFERAIGMN